MGDANSHLRVLALPLYGALAASTRHRVCYFLPELEARNIRVDLAPFLSDDYLARRFDSGEIDIAAVASGYVRRVVSLLQQGNYDCAWVQGELNPLLPGWLDRALLRVPYVYDFDDAFYLKYALRGGLQGRLLGRKFQQFIAGNAPGQGFRERETAAGQRAGLVKDERLGPRQRFQIVGALG